VSTLCRLALINACRTKWIGYRWFLLANSAQRLFYFFAGKGLTKSNHFLMYSKSTCTARVLFSRQTHFLSLPGQLTTNEKFCSFFASGDVLVRNRPSGATS
jgi:hypothetical protein